MSTRDVFRKVERWLERAGEAIVEGFEQVAKDFDDLAESIANRLRHKRA